MYSLRLCHLILPFMSSGASWKNIFDKKMMNIVIFNFINLIPVFWTKFPDISSLIKIIIFPVVWEPLFLKPFQLK